MQSAPSVPMPRTSKSQVKSLALWNWV